MLLEPGVELEATAILEPDVDDRAVEGVSLALALRALESIGCVHLEAVQRECVLHHAPHRGLIIHEQNDWHSDIR
jgi:hypothetical protein